MSSIPTTYNGIRFRSRLEAKWAVFFDQLRWTWHYEPLDLDGWIPDFLIETKTLPILVEVKPITKLDLSVVRKIAKATGQDFSNLAGDEMPGGTGEYHYLICGLGPYQPEEWYDDDYAIGWLSDYIFMAEFLPAVVTLTNNKWGLTAGMAGAWFDRVLDIHGKKSRAWVGADYIAPLWAEACNVTQWKAPRGRR